MKPTGWEHFSRAAASGFERYAEWLVGISWKKFFLLSILLLIGAGLLGEIPPFSLKFTVSNEDAGEPTPKKSSKAAKLKEKFGDADVTKSSSFKPGVLGRKNTFESYRSETESIGANRVSP